MSEIAHPPVTAATAPTAAPAAPTPAASGPLFSAPVGTVREAYSFACMRCGYGWEQSYDIEHHTDGKGQPFIIHRVEGERVPSPLSNPTCHNCGGHVVRIMREGQVSAVLGMIDQLYHHRIAPGIAGPVPAGADVPRPPKQRKAAARTHDAPGPVAIDPDERTGWFARLKARLSRS